MRRFVGVCGSARRPYGSEFLNRRYSLKKNKEFRYVYNTGKSVSSRHMALVYRMRKTPGVKVGFSVSKKVGKSVVRNKVKRRMKHAYAAYLPNTDRSLLIFVAKPSVTACTFKEISAEIKYLLKKAGILTEDGMH